MEYEFEETHSVRIGALLDNRLFLPEVGVGESAADEQHA